MSSTDTEPPLPPEGRWSAEPTGESEWEAQPQWTEPGPVNGSPPGRRGAPNGRFPVRQPERRPEVEPDESPTTALPAGDPTATDPEFPGRHRRRAGGSPEERPAAAYQDLTPKGRKPKSGRRRRSTFWKELPLLIVVALALTFLIQTFVAKVYVIPSGSMETTLHGCTGCTNDRVLVDKMTYRFSDPQPGDVVVFRGPDSWSSEVRVETPTNPVVAGLQQFGSLIGLAPPDEKDFVKRVIAVGGQTVQCCDSRGSVMVDGKSLNEPYIYYLPGAGPPKQQSFGPVTVPPGQLWMMGDSRNNSADSRVADHGPVPLDDVIGKARVVVLPFSRFGWIPAHDPQAAAVGLGDPYGQPFSLGLLALLPLGRRLRSRSAARDTFLPR